MTASSASSSSPSASGVDPVHVDGTAPYAWPYDGRIDPDSVALVLAGWDLNWHAKASTVDGSLANCHRLAAAVDAFGGLVVAVSHGAGPPQAFALPVGTVHLAAAGIDGFYDGPLDALLRREGRTHLLVAGLGLEAPVHSTLRSANDRGYECLLLTDACAVLDVDLAGAAAHTVTMSGGIFGAIGTTAAVLSCLASRVSRPVTDVFAHPPVHPFDHTDHTST